MKKLICVLLSVVLLLAGLSVLTVAQETNSDETPVEKTINDYLTAWWNFNGDNEQEQLRDKAPAGATADNLHRISSTAENIVISGGICDIKPDDKTALWLDMTEGNSDVRMTEKTTLFIKFRFSGTNSGHADILQMEGLYRIFRHANGDLRVTLDSVKDSTNTAVTLISPQTINPDQDIYFALVSEADTTAKTFRASMYFSTDGETYTKTDFTYENMNLSFGGGRGQATANGMFLGNHRLKKNHGLSYLFDDVRIYSKSFTDAEVAQITKLATEEAPEIIPEVTTPDPDATTAEPKPELPKDGTINDYLISWWNFEGADATEQMKDKAVRGANQDDLEIKGTVTVDNGVAYVSKDAGNGLFAARSEDLIGVESMTLYAKLKYTGSHQDWPDSIYYDGLYRYFNYQYDATYADTSLRACFFGSQYLLAPGNQGQDTWYYVILTTEIDSEAEKMNFSVSVSVDGITWVTSSLSKDLDVATLSSIKVKQKAESAGLCLGKASRWLDRGVGYYFDDVRIYGKALSSNEFSLIQENTTDLRDPSTLPEQNVTTEPGIAETTAPQEPGITTERPVLTAAPRTQATPTKENAPGTEPETGSRPTEGKKGCGATVAVSLALILTVSGVATLAVRKKED